MMVTQPPTLHGMMVKCAVCRIEAVDADEGDNARLTYTLHHGDQSSLFHVDEQTGALTITRSLPAAAAETAYR